MSGPIKPFTCLVSILNLSPGKNIETHLDHLPLVGQLVY